MNKLTLIIIVLIGVISCVDNKLKMRERFLFKNWKPLTF